MINKTFNSDSTDGRALEVGRNGERTWLNIREFDLENTMFMLAPADAPALCLAILEAAGYSEEYEGGNCWAGPLGQAMHMLRLETEAQERAIAEARERAELEAEAFNLYRAYMSVHEPLNAIGDWHMLAERTKEKWLAVARRAREMRAEK